MSCCCPSFCYARTSASTGQAKDYNAGIHLAESANFTKNNDVCIGWPQHSSDVSTVDGWPLRSSDMSTVELVWTEGLTHNTDNNPPRLLMRRYRRTEHHSEYAKPVGS